MTLDNYYFSNKGGRDHNEDSVSSRIEGANGIFVVADGLGGHQFGEAASKCVVDTMIERFLGTRLHDCPWLTESFEDCNRRIMAMQNEKRCVMKSTAVALAIDGRRACWANTGDSRLYFIHDRDLANVTEDHSVAFKKYKTGEITREQIRNDVDQSRLLKAVGNEDRWVPDTTEWPFELESGDAFMLCSDGIWEYLLDEEIVIEYLKADTAKEWAELLLTRVLSRIRHGNDNLSLVTVMVG